MRQIDRSLWQTLSPIFDRALELEPQQRAEFVSSVKADHPVVAQALEDLLAAHERVVTSDFLETPPIDVPTSLVGQTVGAYTLERPLGMGGMGTVWLARRSDGRFEGHVALKLVNLAVFDAALKERFAREGNFLARLAHPHIARLFDAGVTTTGQPFLVLEYVDGMRIDEYADARRLDLSARLELFGQVADAVAHAHANLLVHRDLKPSNILVDGGGQVKLLDFGIAKLIEDDRTVTLPVPTVPVLTPKYAAPEQVSGGMVTTSTDVYALGVLLYELLGGCHPTAPDGSDTAGQVRALTEREPLPLSDAFRMLSPDAAARIAADRSTSVDRLPRMCRGDLDTILATALKKPAEERYRSVTALADDVRRVLEHRPIAARPDSTAYRVAKFVRRHRVPLALASFGVIALAAGVAGTIVQGRHATREAALARQQRDLAHAAAAQAQSEAAKAQRIADVLTSVFDAASPYEHPGPTDARQLLERGSDQVARRLEREPVMRAEIATMLGEVWLRLGETARAAALIGPAVADLERLRGPTDAITARAWVALAKVRRRQGRNPEARQLVERALAVERATLGEGDRNTLTAQAVYANLLKWAGDFEGARRTFESAVAGLGRLGDSAQIEYAQALGDLGLVLQRLDDWEGAERAHRRSHEILVDLFGPDSPRAAVGLGNLAEVLTHFGRLDEARTALEEVIRVNQRVFGESGFPAESVFRNSLAYVDLDSGDARAARAEFQRAIAAAERERGPGHSDVAWPMRGMASADLKLGNLAEAETINERALALRTKFYGRQHWEVAQSLADLAELAGRRGDRARQERFLREALAIRRAVHPPTHPERARAVIALGGFLCSHGSKDEGAALLREGLGLARSDPKQFVDEARRASAALAACGPAARTMSARR